MFLLFSNSPPRLGIPNCQRNCANISVSKIRRLSSSDFFILNNVKRKVKIMSNLIRYIIQEDPEKQMKKKQTNRNNKMTNLLETPFAQIFGAASDMYKNYNDMKEDNVIGNDDYFHCKANYESTQRGKWGEKTAEALGDAKERIDYFKNRIIKGTSAIDAYADYEHDKYINSLGRHQAKSGLYTNAKDGCEFKRKKL